MAQTAQKTSTIPGIAFVQKQQGISEYTLKSNGLRILLAPDHSVPIAGCMITYHVGSRNEAIGYTGSTHLLEHLMFKGSKNFKREDGRTADVLFDAKGGILNATTWMDRTNYYEVIPKNLLPLAIELEADRMRNAKLVEFDRASEMPAVRSEFEIGENSPIQALDKQLWSTAYQAHPYHHDTIGWRSDIENVSIERLQQFYNDFYWPNNATITITGDFDAMEMLKNIKKYFGVHSSSPKPIPGMYTTEPKQEGERRTMIHRSGSNFVGISHKIPSATDKDIPALVTLAEILSGGKTSRLQKVLVDTGKSTGLSTSCYQFRDPGLFTTYVGMTPKESHADIEKAVKDEYLKIIQKGVTATELARVKRSIRTYIAGRRDGLYSFLSSINEEISLLEWSRFVTFPKALEKVTAADVQRVAKKYLVDEQSTIGWFVNTAP